MTQTHPMPAIVLASSSAYRRELLNKLGLEISQQSPDIDETPQANETPEALVTRLAEQKARALNTDPNTPSLIIGSDQVCVVNERIVGKPHTVEAACEQLRNASGQRVTFYTGLCLLDNQSGEAQSLCEPYHVHFRVLSEAAIARYVAREKPLNCAGSFKSEGYGISLFSRLEGDDPNSLIGLPLIRLIALLETHGISIP